MVKLTEAFTTNIVEDHTEDGLRSGEGSIVELANGHLLMFYSCFQGWSDDAPAFIARRISRDGGETWSPPEVQFERPEGALNSMGVSLLRLQDGRIACSYGIKWAHDHLVAMVTFSSDEGKTWSPCLPVTDQKGYLWTNNDRLLQLRDGTLLVPFCRLEESKTDAAVEGGDLRFNMPCGVFYSVDGGATWEKSPHEIKHTPEVFTMPLYIDEQITEGHRENLRCRLGVFQEPGLVELQDGRIMMYMRSSYAIYRCFARHPAAPWEDCGIFEGLNVCIGPQTIRRDPESGKLIMLYNDRGTHGWGSWTSEYNFRTPLSVAVSSDEAASWQRWGALENESHNYCYFSLLFLKGKFIASYYQSGNPIKASKNPRRNLASLKVCRGASEIFSAQ